MPDVAADAAVEHPAAAHLKNIEDVEGIGPAYAEKLAAVGIKTTDDLLAAGAKPYDREKLAEQTGISSKSIREWVDNVDLMRVPGVGPQYSDLLEAAGVGSPAELAQRNPANLAITVQEVVAARPGIVRRIPSEAEIAGWIEEAGKLEQVVEH
jgi:predicted flap endonuclease-1-like 5' DNA nuclease